MNIDLESYINIVLSALPAELEPLLTKDFITVQYRSDKSVSECIKACHERFGSDFSYNRLGRGDLFACIAFGFCLGVVISLYFVHRMYHPAPDTTP